MNGLDLFSGIGGITFALSEWVKPIAYCEIDPFCQSILLSRIDDGCLPKAAIWDDITTFPFESFRNAKVDIMYGGFPCQDISIAGNGKGLEGKRSGLFFEIMRLAKEIKPQFLFLENVPAITTRGGLQVVKEITNLGYDSRWCIISAAEIGAVHERERWFLLAKHRQINANPNSESSRKTNTPSKPIETKQNPWMGFTGFCGIYETQLDWQEDIYRMDWVDNGLPKRLDEARALGNAVVPLQAKKAFEILMGIK